MPPSNDLTGWGAGAGWGVGMGWGWGGGMSISPLTPGGFFFGPFLHYFKTHAEAVVFRRTLQVPRRPRLA